MTRRLICAQFSMLMLLVGCSQQSAVDQESAVIRKQLLVQQLPGESSTISAARLMVLEKKASGEPVELVITGNIDANGHDPWETDQSAFAVTDASDEFVRVAKAHNHDDGDCPFCKHKSDPNQFMAVVQVVDDQGKVLPRSAKGLLGLKTKQTIVIQGQGTLNEQDMLVVVPKAIYLAN